MSIHRQQTHSIKQTMSQLIQQNMEIILVRHGKPDIPPLSRLTAAAFHQWVEAYNSAGLCPSSLPSQLVLDCAADSDLIVCSKLPRSIESANALNIKKSHLSDALYNEADLPIAHWQGPKLSPRVWAVFFRVLWLLGYSKNSESLKAAKARAAKGAATLSELASHHGRVMFVGHGIYNRLLTQALRESGWIGPKNPGTRHWSLGIYQKPGQKS
jgi:broad specificity phosphatase PhoE